LLNFTEKHKKNPISQEMGF